jgi:hypothetical protein
VGFVALRQNQPAFSGRSPRTVSSCHCAALCAALCGATGRSATSPTSSDDRHFRSPPSGSDAFHRAGILHGSHRRKEADAPLRGRTALHFVTSLGAGMRDRLSHSSVLRQLTERAKSSGFAASGDRTDLFHGSCNASGDGGRAAETAVTGETKIQPLIPTMDEPVRSRTRLHFLSAFARLRGFLLQVPLAAVTRDRIAGRHPVSAHPQTAPCHRR